MVQMNMEVTRFIVHIGRCKPSHLPFCFLQQHALHGFIAKNDELLNIRDINT